MARCRDLLSIPSLKNLKLLGGEAGLSRPMTWVYSILSQPFSNWVNFGDLIFYNAAGRDTSEVMLLRAVSEAEKKVETCDIKGIKKYEKKLITVIRNDIVSEQVVEEG